MLRGLNLVCVMVIVGVIIKMIKIIAILFLITSTIAYANDYSTPDISEYYELLRQPDRPEVSCCGDGDAYYADKVEECPLSLTKNECFLIAIITDTRSDIIKTSKGDIIHRHHVEPGTKIIVPPHKIRKEYIPNPTNHNIIFLNYNLNVFCWEPLGGI